MFLMWRRGVGFEPHVPLTDKTLSRRPRYGHFSASPRGGLRRTEHTILSDHWRFSLITEAIVAGAVRPPPAARGIFMHPFMTFLVTGNEDAPRMPGRSKLGRNRDVDSRPVGPGSTVKVVTRGVRRIVALDQHAPRLRLGHDSTKIRLPSIATENLMTVPAPYPPASTHSLLNCLGRICGWPLR